MKHTSDDDVAARLRTGMIAATIVLLLAACGNEAQDQRDNVIVSKYEIAKLPPAPPPPFEPAIVRAAVAQQESFQQVRRAQCPKRIIDRIEERRHYPACEMMHALKYVTISDGTSYGNYEKVMDLTSLGREMLGTALEEQADRYVVTVARRELMPGTERFEKAPGRDDRVLVSFRWQWKPLNPLGEGLDLRDPYTGRDDHEGRATYDRTADGWQFVELWLMDDGKDYLRRV